MYVHVGVIIIVKKYMYNACEHHFYVHVHTCIIHTTCTCTYMYTRGIIISTCIHVHVVPDLIKFTYYDGSYTLIR